MYIKEEQYNEEYYSTEIESLYNEYLSFNDEMKALLTSTHKLERLYQNLQEINNLSTIYYLNPETTRNVYLSKQELCEAFFTDFYYYIVTYHGTKHLENNGLYDVAGASATARAAACANLLLLPTT